MKKLLLSAIALSAIIPVATAQSHHGYYTIPEMADAEAYVNNITTAKKTLNCWVTPSLVMPMEKADKTIEASNIYNNNSADMIVRPTTMNGSTYFSRLTGTSVTPSITTESFKNGYLEVTIPEKMDYPRTDANTPNWQNLPATGNVINFHICLATDDRINVTGNGSSATGDDSELYDCTGAYVGIKAPAGCTVKAFLSCSSISAANYKKDTSGIQWNTNFHGTVSTAAFDFAEVCDGTYKEMTSGAPYNCLAAMKYSSTSYPKGFATKYIDVAVYGVKPGDVIGFGGIQTLHDGWTPKTFVNGAGVNDILADDSNAPVEYYNLQGVKVSADNLSNGIYVKRQGSKATKFVVK